MGLAAFMEMTKGMRRLVGRVYFYGLARADLFSADEHGDIMGGGSELAQGLLQRVPLLRARGIGEHRFVVGCRVMEGADGHFFEFRFCLLTPPSHSSDRPL